MRNRLTKWPTLVLALALAPLVAGSLGGPTTGAVAEGVYVVTCFADNPVTSDRHQCRFDGESSTTLYSQSSSNSLDMRMHDPPGPEWGLKIVSFEVVAAVGQNLGCAFQVETSAKTPNTFTAVYPYTSDTFTVRSRIEVGLNAVNSGGYGDVTPTGVGSGYLKDVGYTMDDEFFIVTVSDLDPTSSGNDLCTTLNSIYANVVVQRVRL